MESVNDYDFFFISELRLILLMMHFQQPQTAPQTNKNNKKSY